MPFTHIVTRSYQDSSQVPITGREVLTGDNENHIDSSFSKPQTNLEIDWAVTRSQLVSIGLLSDTAATVKTNSSGTPVDTLTLTAGVERVWTLAGDGLPACPFSADVTKLFVTVGGTGTARFQIRALLAV